MNLDPTTISGPGFGANQSGNPWFNLANQYAPRNLHDIIRWARYIILQSPTATEVIRKLATYPITDFNIDTKSEPLKKRYRDIFKSLKLKESLQNCGFEFFSIGNVFVSIYLPINRELVCPKCLTRHSSKKASFLSFKKWEFTGACPTHGCGYSGVFTRHDSKSMNVADINIIKWTPEHIVVNHNPITGEKDFYYKIPNSLKQKIQRGDRLAVNSTPWGFIEAIRHNQDFKFDTDAIFHLQNISTGGSIEGVAVPPMLSLFSLVFYQATLRKANEAIATEYLTPLRTIFPQAQTGNSDPSLALNLKNFRNIMENAIRLHKRDKNHYLIAPVPIGYNALSGEGKNLMVSQEIAQAEEQILISLGVSQELLSGTTNWTSTSVGLRMMENTLLSYISRIEDLVSWSMAKITAYLGLANVEVSMVPFRLLDDPAFKQLLLSLASSGKASLTTLFEENGLDFHSEMENLIDEAAAAASSVVETQVRSEQAQFMAASKAGEDITKDLSFVSALAKSQMIYEQISGASPEDKKAMLNQLKMADYGQYWMVSQLMAGVLQEEQPQTQVEQPQPQENTDAKQGQ
jgi:hypothetical protein